ncbi:MAG: alpha-1,2-fucosyltransferase [Moraxellaceae bacterium]|nr:alpha-1,2-fucosyltransferase [Moraxellaceae bacterium]
MLEAQSSDNIHVSGYFQSENIYAYSRLFPWLTLNLYSALRCNNLNMNLQAQAAESVTIHVRRGDYVSDSKTLSISWRVVV